MVQPLVLCKVQSLSFSREMLYSFHCHAGKYFEGTENMQEQIVVQYWSVCGGCSYFLLYYIFLSILPLMTLGKWWDELLNLCWPDPQLQNEGEGKELNKLSAAFLSLYSGSLWSKTGASSFCLNDKDIQQSQPEVPSQLQTFLLQRLDYPYVSNHCFCVI